jgi:hypothetical protein
MTDKPKKKTGLELLREPFPENQIGKLPKPTKKQTDEVRADFRAGIRCGVCKQWHHPDVVHLDYVGHAPLTDRLLDADPKWNWEPMAVTNGGLPAIVSGELWIKLTVCGVMRLGVGDAQGKTGTNATKEMIGDALRNAGMRFGMALDLWHKGDLHANDGATPTQKTPLQNPPGAEHGEQQAPRTDGDLEKGARAILMGLKIIEKEGEHHEIAALLDKSTDILAQLEKGAPKWFAQINSCVELARIGTRSREEFPGDM